MGMNNLKRIIILIVTLILLAIFTFIIVSLYDFNDKNKRFENEQFDAAVLNDVINSRAKLFEFCMIKGRCAQRKINILPPKERIEFLKQDMPMKSYKNMQQDYRENFLDQFPSFYIFKDEKNFELTFGERFANFFGVAKKYIAYLKFLRALKETMKPVSDCPIIFFSSNESNLEILGPRFDNDKFVRELIRPHSFLPTDELERYFRIMFARNNLDLTGQEITPSTGAD